MDLAPAVEMGPAGLREADFFPKSRPETLGVEEV